MHPLRPRLLVGVAAASAALSLAVASVATAAPAVMGPSTTTTPYMLPVAPGVEITSLLTVDDAGSAANGYEMVGIPDGLGAYRKGDTVTVLMNHELNTTEGIPRRHGQQGAFVSELKINRGNYAVEAGQDLIDPGVRYWNYLTGSYSTAPNAAGTQPDGDAFPAYDARFGRFCSGALTDERQLYNKKSGKGYDGQLYFANEEVGDEGRTFAVTTEGAAQQLPRLGLFSWENTLAAPNRSDTTLVMGQEDTAGGQLWAYVGTKQSTGSPAERAGLGNGVSNVIDLLDETVSTDAQFRTAVGKGVAAPFKLADVDWDQSGKDQNTEALADGLTLNRIEDGAFDPKRPNDFYFVTTAGGNGPGGGVWLARFNENPSSGGTLTLLLDGSEGLVFPDNVDIDTKDNLLIQEDPGNNPHVARIMAYRIADGALATLAAFDPALFTAGQPGFITQDEESSGIIDVSRLLGGEGTFLFDAQVHAPTANNGAEYVQRGQLMLMKVTNWDRIYGG